MSQRLGRGLLQLSEIKATGAGVRVVVADSGVHAAHPHVRHVAGGIRVDAAGGEHDDYIDRLGHGTAVTAVIREKAPDADIFAVQIFDRELATTAEALVGAIRWAIRHDAHLVNLSLGTTNSLHEGALAVAVGEATSAHVTIVAAAPEEGRRWLPGAMPGVIGVELDWTSPRDACFVTVGLDGAIRMRASGYPRPIPGVSPERNLKGLSFAVANATGLLARLLEGHAAAGSERYLTSILCGALEGESGTTPSS